MDNTTINKEIDEIDFSKVDWNSLDIDEFNALEQKLSERDQHIKDDKVRKVRIETKLVSVKIKGKTYQITSSLYERLKDIKSEVSKQKLINEIITSHQAIIEI